MVLKNKRITGIAHMIFLAAVLLLYTKIGGTGMIYAAGFIEIFFVIVYLFLGGIPDAVEYMSGIRTRKEQSQAISQIIRAAVLYGAVSTVLIELLLFIVSEMVISRTEVLYIDVLLKLSMLAVPFLSIMQVLCGVCQTLSGKMLSGIAKLIFSGGTVGASFVSYILLKDYGAKAAALLQDTRISYFYILTGLIPGVITGAVFASIFLAVMCLIKRTSGLGRAGSREKLSVLCAELFRVQAAEAISACMKHIPMVVLLWLSVGEISNENYLFGHFYGAILPAIGMTADILDMGLIPYKKRLYMAYRKKQGEAFYRDLKCVLCYVMIAGTAMAAFTLALYKSYLAIWNLQTFTNLVHLTMASSLLGFLWLPGMVLEDILRCRSMYPKVVFSIFCGMVVSILCAVSGFLFMGAGTGLYILCIGMQLLVTMLIAAWNIAMAIGINYLTVLYRAGGSCIAALIIGGVLFGIQTIVFTAFGGIATMIICIAIGLLLLLFGTMKMHVFSKGECKNLPFSFLTRWFF